MPLPPALAARLSKRGIITPKHKPSEPLKKIDYKGLSTCPNKNNIFHECTRWCETHWKGVLTPEPKYMRNMQKLLAKFPLPNNWTEVFDKGVGRYYYWNMETDMVSWLPPKHPKALLTRSAAKLRERRILAEKEEKLKDKDTAKKDKENDRTSDKEKDRESDEDDRNHRSKYADRRDRDRDKEREDRRKRDRDDRHRRDKEKRQKKDDQLDPMDPAAYSDVPQGTWSDGLETNKIRADNTASGVLFQQRPYPAPGAVLAANKDKDRKK